MVAAHKDAGATRKRLATQTKKSAVLNRIVPAMDRALLSQEEIRARQANLPANRHGAKRGQEDETVINNREVKSAAQDPIVLATEWVRRAQQEPPPGRERVQTSLHRDHVGQKVVPVVGRRKGGLASGKRPGGLPSGCLS